MNMLQRVHRQRTPRNNDELLVALLDRLEPDNKAQRLALVITRDLPAAGSGYIDTYQHGSGRAWKRVRRRERQKGWSEPIEPSSCDFEFRWVLFSVIKILAHPKSLCG